MTQFTRCTAQNISAVMEFVQDHWVKNHILAWHRPLMDWQHRDECHTDMYNWLLASEENVLQGVLGYIPISKYDAALKADPFTWMALWKIRTDATRRGIGLQLLSRLLSGTKGPVGVLGINPSHSTMYKALGWSVGELSQHFICNPAVSQNVISAPADYPLPRPVTGRAILKEVDATSLSTLELDVSEPRQPHKTPLYFQHRYKNHPVYIYKVYMVLMEGRPKALLAMRIAENESSQVLRLVDFLGDEAALAQCGAALGDLLLETKCEYVDLWQFGIKEESLTSCGFAQVPSNGAVVVPNYFEPFLRRNARIEFAVKRVPEDKLAIFRGDGDQDRPNRLVADSGIEKR